MRPNHQRMVITVAWQRTTSVYVRPIGGSSSARGAGRGMDEQYIWKKGVLGVRGVRGVRDVLRVREVVLSDRGAEAVVDGIGRAPRMGGAGRTDDELDV